jgi:hypothetical protein
MSFFAPPTKAIELGDGNTVQLRKMTYGEMLATYADGIEHIGVEQTIASLVAWSGPGFDGKPATRENFLALPFDVASTILKAAIDLNSVSKDEGEASGVATS